MKLNHEWHKGFFRNSFYNPASPAAVAKAPDEVRFILGRLNLKKGANLLDLCCGPGRHAVLIAKKGISVTGYDFSAEYLGEAAQRAKKAGIGLCLIQGDMRRLKFKNEFDAVVNLFTSFGYFQRFSDDIRTLKGVSRALKPGGLFMLDVVHGDFIRKNFRQRDWIKLENGSYHLEDAVLTDDGVFNTWTLIGKGKVKERAFFSRLYTKDRISAAMLKAGLEPLKFWGNFKGDPLSPKRNRLIVLAKKI